MIVGIIQKERWTYSYAVDLRPWLVQMAGGNQQKRPFGMPRLPSSYLLCNRFCTCNMSRMKTRKVRNFTFLVIDVVGLGISKSSP